MQGVETTPLTFFLVLGRKTPTKGYDLIVRTVAALRQQGGFPELVLIGPDEDGVTIDRPGVYPLGPQPREVVRGALSECLGLVTMSSSESFGIVICEAWLFGKPVIANRACYSFRELVEHGETGFLVDTKEELEQAMKLLATNPALGARMGRTGRAAALEGYTWGRVANEVYGNLVAAVDHRSKLKDYDVVQ